MLDRTVAPNTKQLSINNSLVKTCDLSSQLANAVIHDYIVSSMLLILVNRGRAQFIEKIPLELCPGCRIITLQQLLVILLLSV